MTKIHVSNVCRIDPSAELLDFIANHGAGVIKLDSGLLEPRQVVVHEEIDDIAVILRWHRDTFVPTVTRRDAHLMVTNDYAHYADQSALVYSMDDYLADPDVRKDAVEWDRARQAQKSGTELALVAIIGDSRSPVSVCRNIVSGCQSMETVFQDAKGAIESSRTLLIED